MIDGNRSIMCEVSALAEGGVAAVHAAFDSLDLGPLSGSNGVLRGAWPGTVPRCAILLPLGAPQPGLAAGADRVEGAGVARIWGPAASCLAALRFARMLDSALAYPPLVLAGAVPVEELAAQAPAGVPCLSLEGWIAPRFWPGCFGTFDALLRVRGLRPDPGVPNRAVSALDEVVPLLTALQALRQRVMQRSFARSLHDPAMPLRGRLTVAAVHGGHNSRTVPTLCDVLVTRRYAPGESFDDAVAELNEVVEAAMAGCRAGGVDTIVSNHRPPQAEPGMGPRSRADAAVTLGFGWPHDMFGGAPPGVETLGGLMATDSTGPEWTSLQTLQGLTRSVVAYLGMPELPEPCLATVTYAA